MEGPKAPTKGFLSFGIKATSPTRPAAPPIYRPTPALQLKMSGPARPAAPPVYRPTPAFQLKAAAPPVYRPAPPSVLPIGLKTQVAPLTGRIPFRPHFNVVQRTTELSKAVNNPLLRLHQNSLLWDGQAQLYCIAMREGDWHLSIFVSNATADQVNAVSKAGNLKLQEVPNWQNLTFENFHIVQEGEGKRNHHFYNDNGTVLWAQTKNEAPLGAESWKHANRMAVSFFSRLGIQVNVNTLDERVGVAAPTPVNKVQVEPVPVSKLPTNMLPRALRNAAAKGGTPKPTVVPQQPPPTPVPIGPLVQHAPHQQFPFTPIAFMRGQQDAPQQQGPPTPMQIEPPLTGRGNYPYDESSSVYAPNELSPNLMEIGDFV